jgi:hypothetical protein
VRSQRCEQKTAKTVNGHRCATEAADNAIIQVKLSSHTKSLGLLKEVRRGNSDVANLNIQNQPEDCLQSFMEYNNIWSP